MSAAAGTRFHRQLSTFLYMLQKTDSRTQTEIISSVQLLFVVAKLWFEVGLIEFSSNMQGHKQNYYIKRPHDWNNPDFHGSRDCVRADNHITEKLIIYFKETIREGKLRKTVY